MKNKLLKFFFTISTLLVCLTCSSQITTTPKQDFEFHYEKESIVLEITTGKSFLELDKETTVKIKLENIDPKTLSSSGQGIKFSKNQDSNQAVSLDIKPTGETIEDDKYCFHPSGSRK